MVDAGQTPEANPDFVFPFKLIRDNSMLKPGVPGRSNCHSDPEQSGKVNSKEKLSLHKGPPPSQSALDHDLAGLPGQKTSSLHRVFKHQA